MGCANRPQGNPGDRGVRLFSLAREMIIVDVTPDELQERMRQGKIYPLERIERSLSNFFTQSNISMLRELALREALRASSFCREEELNLNIRASIGLATFPHDARTAHDVIRQADGMMYLVKNSTRDNIGIAQRGVLK